MHESKVKGAKAPVRHDFDEASITHEFGLNDRRQVADATAGQECRRQADIVIHREVRLERDSLLGGNTLVLQSAIISPNIAQRFLRRRDRTDQILDLGIELITRELDPGFGSLPLANENRRLGRARLGIAM